VFVAIHSWFCKVAEAVFVRLRRGRDRGDKKRERRDDTGGRLRWYGEKGREKTEQGVGPEREEVRE